MKRHIIPAIAIVLTSLSGGAFGDDESTVPAPVSTEVRVRVVNPYDDNPVTSAQKKDGVVQHVRSVLSKPDSHMEAAPGDYDYDYDYGYDCDSECGGILDGGVTCGGGRIAFDVEFTFMRYGQEGGVTDLAGAPGQFDLQLAPRFELGYERADGLGARLRYWFYDESTQSVANNVIAVQADYFDMEIFQRLDVGCNTDVEISGGIRFLEFGRTSTSIATPTAAIFNTNAFGGIIAIESRTHLRRGAMYARARWGILQGDVTVTQFNPGTVVTNANDNPIQQLELAFGYEITRCTDWGVFSARLGAEWQQWANATAAGAAVGGAGNNDVMDDASFAGIVFGIGFER